MLVPEIRSKELLYQVLGRRDLRGIDQPFRRGFQRILPLVIFSIQLTSIEWGFAVVVQTFQGKVVQGFGPSDFSPALGR